MDNQLRHYHLGCGHRLQTNFSDLRSELRDKFQIINKKLSSKLSENGLNESGKRRSTIGKVE